MKIYTCVAFVASLLMSMPTTAKSSAEEATAQGLSAVTVFLDVNQFTRKHSAAKNMTRSHNEFAAEGFELVDVSPYLENGDLEGFFVSYKKTKS